MLQNGKLTLTLLMSRVGAYHVDFAFAADYFAVFTDSLDAGANFHRKAFQGEILGIFETEQYRFLPCN